MRIYTNSRCESVAAAGIFEKASGGDFAIEEPIVETKLVERENSKVLMQRSAAIEENKMSSSTQLELSSVNISGGKTSRKRRINFRRKSDRARIVERKVQDWLGRTKETESPSGCSDAAPPSQPVNQRYRDLCEQGALSSTDPIRPSKKHRAEGRDDSRTSQEIYALGDLLMVNMSSIARRTPYPEALLWPLVSALAHLVAEFLDEKSDYEMGELDAALMQLEVESGGKLRFARHVPI
ncbi:MAG: hypothetical protein K2X07_00175 [Caulobacteraceae bacterium]|nr:hypothetical protein [Caulobacteraceae bacterium]